MIFTDISGVENFLRNISADTLSNTFYYLMIGVFLLSIYSKKVLHKFNSLTDYSPTLLTSMGILGTFTGIVSGLLNFDNNNIDGSISLLLGGMKTAFITSVIGVFLSIVLKVIYSINYFQKNINTDDEKSVLESFNQIASNIKELTTTNKNIYESIGGENSDSSLLTQFKTLKSDLSDQRKEFNKFKEELFVHFHEFSEMLSKSATEQVIEALKQVIVEFNEKLTEQFGENFKELNRAVFALVEWQDKYKEQIAQMIAQYELGVKSISDTEKSVSSIEKSSQSIPESMSKLEGVIKLNQEKVDELNEHLNAFSELKENAVKAIPEIQNQISTMLTNVDKATTDMTTAISGSVKEINDGIEKNNSLFLETSNTLTVGQEQISNILSDTTKNLTEQNKNIGFVLRSASNEISENTSRWIESFSIKLNDVQNDFVKSINQIVDEQKESISIVMSGLKAECKDIVETTGDDVKEELSMIDSAMQSEITRVFEKFGSVLLNIVKKFANDYSDVVIPMKELSNRSRY